MRGFNYRSQLTFSYSKQINEMKQILENDGYKQFEINEQQNVIKYSIPNERVIRLDNLLYLFKIKYVKITIAQMIQLCLQIVYKYKQIQQNSIQHNYLHKNRILLQLVSQQESLSILPIKLYYQIHFIGYDCPFYEQKDYKNSKINDKDAIKSIVEEILKYLEQYSKKKVKNNLKFQTIIQNLRLQINQSFDSFIQEINKIYKEYSNLNNQNQMLQSLDKKIDNLNFRRYTRNQNVQENLQALKQNYFINDSWHLFEFYLYNTLPLITKEFRKGAYYSQQKPPKDLQFINFQNSLMFYDKKLINDVINKEIENVNKQFKFEWDLHTIQKEIIEIILLKFQFLQYFLNDIQQMDINDIEQIKNQIDLIKENITKETIEQEIQNYLELMILQMIDELI
ncbi:unnamed protein product [Paramecium sonneborni]|uniref:Uncharacterized protein n=1 Tax=Paramecium sonneborni TaxID=65129 RepID=A0A8S1M4S9_9CILI|nr:unnamed protein product [Paramecium sonneborni]